jgi:hypothetical protein
VFVLTTETSKAQEQDVTGAIDGDRKPLRLITCAIITNMIEKLSSATAGELFHFD